MLMLVYDLRDDSCSMSSLSYVNTIIVIESIELVRASRVGVEVEG